MIDKNLSFDSFNDTNNMPLIRFSAFILQIFKLTTPLKFN